MNKKAEYFKFFFWSTLILVCIFCWIFVSSFGATQGTHVGTITAVEHNSNILWPSDNLYFKTDVMSSQEDKYCIREELIPLAKEYAKNKTVVEVEFKNDFIMWKSQCNGKGISIIQAINLQR